MALKVWLMISDEKGQSCDREHIIEYIYTEYASFWMTKHLWEVTHLGFNEIWNTKIGCNIWEHFNTHQVITDGSEI